MPRRTSAAPPARRSCAATSAFRPYSAPRRAPSGTPGTARPRHPEEIRIALGAAPGYYVQCPLDCDGKPMHVVATLELVLEDEDPEGPRTREIPVNAETERLLQLLATCVETDRSRERPARNADKPRGERHDETMPGQDKIEQRPAADQAGRPGRERPASPAQPAARRRCTRTRTTRATSSTGGTKDASRTGWAGRSGSDHHPVHRLKVRCFPGSGTSGFNNH